MFNRSRDTPTACDLAFLIPLGPPLKLVSDSLGRRRAIFVRNDVVYRFLKELILFLSYFFRPGPGTTRYLTLITLSSRTLAKEALYQLGHFLRLDT